VIYEERVTTVSITGVRDYLQLCRERTIPTLKSAGAQVLVLLTGMIGDLGNTFLQMAGFPDINSWQSAQEIFATGREKLVQSEGVRLLKSVASRPRPVIPQEDRRPVYSYRKLFIAPVDLPKFVQQSEQGVWPLYEAAGCRTLGLWTPMASINPLELILMTGYKSAGHWEETRFREGRPEGIDGTTWERGRSQVAERTHLSVRGSWVRLWRAHDF
jgi:hypothetical protein